MIESPTFLIDVTGLLIRYTKAIDTEHGGAFGLARKLEELALWRPQRIYGAFDTGGSLIRNDIYGGYKNWRYSKIDQDMHEKARMLIDSFDGAVVQSEGTEADDVIAWLNDYHDDEQTIIVTGDSDLFGLIGENTTVQMEAGNQSKRQGNWTEGRFVEAFGFDPSDYAKYRALKGDRSDGVPGLDNIGDVTAKEILKEGGDELESDRYRTFYEVLRLRPDDVDLPNFELSSFESVHNGKRRDLYDQLGFESLL